MRHFFILALLFFVSSSNAQFNNDSLEKLLKIKVDSLSGQSGRWQAIYNDTPLIILTDEQNNRMRIISPIIETASLDKGLLLDTLTANFHSALDVKYAISNGILWSVFVHPLDILTDQELTSSINQVSAAAITFGTTFSSTPLLFGASASPKKIEKQQKITLKRT
jgi:hypothetical protein